jgi:hypothetical protein
VREGTRAVRAPSGLDVGSACGHVATASPIITATTDSIGMI